MASLTLINMNYVNVLPWVALINMSLALVLKL